MKKAEKTFFVQNLTEVLKVAKCTVLVDFGGMSVKVQQELKRRLREAGSKMIVAKNTLLKIAGQEAGIDPEILSDSTLSGQTALIYSEEDPISPLQVLGKFIKEFELPQLKVGLVEGDFQTKEGLLRLSQLPGKEELFGQVVGAVAAPTYGLIGTLNANFQKLLLILNQAKEMKGEKN